MKFMKEQLAVQSILKRHLDEIQAQNSSYSLRAFAEKIGVNAGALSAIMNGKRNVSRDLAERIALKLLSDPQKRSELLSLFPKKIKPAKSPQNFVVQSKFKELDQQQFNLIAEWEHYAVLSLMNCQEFSDDHEWIAKRLGITSERSLSVLKNLLQCGLIKRNAEDKLVRTHAAVRSSDDVTNLSLRQSHRVTLDLAKISLDRDPLKERDFAYATMAIDPKKIPQAKELIRRFQDELSDVLESGEKTEVYRFSSQLFPITKISKDTL